MIIDLEALIPVVFFIIIDLEAIIPVFFYDYWSGSPDPSGFYDYYLEALISVIIFLILIWKPWSQFFFIDLETLIPVDFLWLLIWKR